MKIVKYLVLIVFFVFLSFSFWMSPSLGGLIPGGKNAPEKLVSKLEFDLEPTGNFTLTYQSRTHDEKLLELRNVYALDSLIKEAPSDFEKVRVVQSWVQSRWVHDGNSKPEVNDALFILQEAEKGKRFRCVEYSLVAGQCLASLGYTVRNLGLMTKDVNDVNYGAGHAANEVYLRDLEKWIFIDPQFDVITVKDGIPLNAVELQQHIANNIDFEIVNPNGIISKEEYKNWIGPYLYYFYVSLNKGSVGILDRITGTKKQLTLLPKGADKPKYFQRLFRINNSHYTTSLGDFYPKLND
jgi:hypothetical protein